MMIVMIPSEIEAKERENKIVSDIFIKYLPIIICGLAILIVAGILVVLMTYYSFMTWAIELINFFAYS